jgi:hypothetical protein
LTNACANCYAKSNGGNYSQSGHFCDTSHQQAPYSLSRLCAIRASDSNGDSWEKIKQKTPRAFAADLVAAEKTGGVIR